MTRQEFIDNCTYWNELLDICDEYGCRICDDLLDGDTRDDRIDEDISEALNNNYWYQIRESLNSIPSGYDYYIRIGELEYRGLDDDDFERYKEDFGDWGDRNGIWDEDEEEETNQDETNEMNEDEESQTAPEEDFSVGELFALCNGSFVSMLKAEKEEKKSEPDLRFFF